MLDRAGLGWEPMVIEHEGKNLYLDYHTDDLIGARVVIRAYHRNNLTYHVKKNCFGWYDIYCERIVWGSIGHNNVVGHADLG